MVAKSGDALLRDDAVEAILEDLLPLCTLVTPNVPELARMTGLPVGTEDERRTAAQALGKTVAVLAKGGHAEGDEVVDLLWEDGRLHRFSGERLDARSSHGTGCTLSSAVAARLAAGEPLARAVEGAITWLRGALAAAYPLGSGNGPVDHLYLWRNDA
jgi:hydroxymethylpyrimidine/phosphomethylpyrimidine kinase